MASVASSMTGLTSINVVNVNVESGTRRLTSSFSSSSTSSSAGKIDTIVVSYLVNAETRYQSYTELSDQLKQSVKKGKFNRYLTANSILFNAPGFANCSSFSVVTVPIKLFPTEAPTEMPSLRAASIEPTLQPSIKPIRQSTSSDQPTSQPSIHPSIHPSLQSSTSPSKWTLMPTKTPSIKPILSLSQTPTLIPAVEPSINPDATDKPSQPPHHQATTDDEDSTTPEKKTKSSSSSSASSSSPIIIVVAAVVGGGAIALVLFLYYRWKKKQQIKSIEENKPTEATPLDIEAHTDDADTNATNNNKALFKGRAKDSELRTAGTVGAMNTLQLAAIMASRDSDGSSIDFDEEDVSDSSRSDDTSNISIGINMSESSDELSIDEYFLDSDLGSGSESGSQYETQNIRTAEDHHNNNLPTTEDDFDTETIKNKNNVEMEVMSVSDEDDDDDDFDLDFLDFLSDDDEEEDIVVVSPLVKTVQHVSLRQAAKANGDDATKSDKPLSINPPLPENNDKGAIPVNNKSEQNSFQNNNNSDSSNRVSRRRHLPLTTTAERFHEEYNLNLMTIQFADTDEDNSGSDLGDILGIDV